MTAVIYEFSSLLDELETMDLGFSRWRMLDGLIGWLRTRIQIDLGWMSFSDVRSSHCFMLAVGLGVKEIPGDDVLNPIENLLEDWYEIYIEKVAKQNRWSRIKVRVSGENIALVFILDDADIGRGLVKPMFYYTDNY